jgi:hypothetical protein
LARKIEDGVTPSVTGLFVFEPAADGINHLIAVQQVACHHLPDRNQGIFSRTDFAQ